MILAKQEYEVELFSQNVELHGSFIYLGLLTNTVLAMTKGLVRFLAFIT